MFEGYKNLIIIWLCSLGIIFMVHLLQHSAEIIVPEEITRAAPISDLKKDRDEIVLMLKEIALNLAKKKCKESNDKFSCEYVKENSDG